VESEKHRVQLFASVLLASLYVPRPQGKHSPTVPLSCPKKPGRHEHDVLSAEDALLTGHDRQVLAPNTLLIWLSPHAVQFVAVPSAEKNPGGHEAHVSHGVLMNPAEHKHALMAVDPANDVRELSGQAMQGSAGPAEMFRKVFKGQLVQVPDVPVRIPENPGLRERERKAGNGEREGTVSNLRSKD
jgi:hypothetical protein